MSGVCNFARKQNFLDSLVFLLNVWQILNIYYYGYIIELDKQEKQKVIEIFDNPKIKFSPTLPNINL